jgi:hypothetical protein
MCFFYEGDDQLINFIVGFQTNVLCHLQKSHQFASMFQMQSSQILF